MSLSTAITLALLLKKLTRKGTISKKAFRQKKNNNDSAAVSKGNNNDDDSETSSLSSNDAMITLDHKSSSLSEKPRDAATVIVEKSEPTKLPAEQASTVIATVAASIKSNDSTIAQQCQATDNEEENYVLSDDEDNDDDDDDDDDAIAVTIRDFAYSESSPLHHGRPAEARRLSEISLSSSEFTGRQARALYDFTPETEYEIGMKAGDVVWVQYRQCPGWLIADVMDETGLVPESYVEFI